MAPYLAAVLVVLHSVVASSLAVVPERIAVIGGGLAGLSTVVHILDGAAGRVRAIDVYDTHRPGCGGASAVAAGLLHPYTRRGTEIWSGREGFAATAELLSRCEALTGSRVSSGSGLLRLAFEPEQAELLRAAAGGSESASPHQQQWLSREEAARSAGAEVGAHALGAAYAPEALSVDTPAYVRALWALCEAQAAEQAVEMCWRLERAESLAALQGAAAAEKAPYDAIVVASGARAAELSELRELSELVRLCRGQNVLFENPDALRTPLICGKYVVPVGTDNAHLLAGATFEYDPPETAHRPACEQAAAKALRGALAKIHPALEGARVLGAQAGVRALPPRSHFGYVPITGRLRTTVSSARRPVDEAAVAPTGGTWIFGGLGSRGLIHHALIGSAVASALLAGDESRLPEHTRRCQEALPVLECWAPAKS